MEPFGAFADIGCGVVSLLPIDAISVSRIDHPRERFSVGMDIRAMVRSVENRRITLSHKELLGTWEENAAAFAPGETVAGIVRSVEPYGIFVELAPIWRAWRNPRTALPRDSRPACLLRALCPTG